MRARVAGRGSGINFGIALGIWACFACALACAAYGVQTSALSSDRELDGKISILVAVTDRAGHPIEGLGAADFKLFDNSREEKIAAFNATDSAHPPANPAEIQIIVDAMNAGPVTVARERDGVSGFLKQNAAKLEYPTSIWALENQGLKQIAAPSKDGAALLTALNASQSPLRVVDRSAGTWGDVERSDQAIKLVKEMIAPESRPKGRKLVLFVSPGWPLLFNYEVDDRKWLFDDVVEISNGLRTSRTTLYALASSNSNTLLSHDPSDNFLAYSGSLKPVRKISDAQYADLSLQVLAEHSGGVVMSEGNDITAEINRAVRDAGAYYTLTFDRAADHGRTEYHGIRVTVDKPGTRVRTNAGYHVLGP